MCFTEPSCRRCGLGREALLAMMNYGNCSTHFVEHPDSWLPSVRFPANFFHFRLVCIRVTSLENSKQGVTWSKSPLKTSIYPWSWFLIIGLPYLPHGPAVSILILGFVSSLSGYWLYLSYMNFRCYLPRSKKICSEDRLR